MPVELPPRLRRSHVFRRASRQKIAIPILDVLREFFEGFLLRRRIEIEIREPLTNPRVKSPLDCSGIFDSNDPIDRFEKARHRLRCVASTFLPAGVNR